MAGPRRGAQQGAAFRGERRRAASEAREQARHHQHQHGKAEGEMPGRRILPHRAAALAEQPRRSQHRSQ